MALFTAALPAYTGEPERDTKALHSWACSLVGELRSLMYALDKQNVVEAASVAASGIKGTLKAEQIPELDISKIKGERPCVSVAPGAENGVVFYTVAASGERSEAARIYYKQDGENPGLHIEGGDKSIYVHSKSSIHLNGETGGVT